MSSEGQFIVEGVVLTGWVSEFEREFENALIEDRLLRLIYADLKPPNVVDGDENFTNLKNEIDTCSPVQATWRNRGLALSEARSK